MPDEKPPTEKKPALPTPARVPLEHPMLGHKIRDEYTGLEGRCYGVCFYETGCVHLGMALPSN